MSELPGDAQNSIFPLRPLKLGNVHVNPPLVLAPMAGLTDMTFRRIVKQRGGVGLVVSELLSSEGLTRDSRRSLESMAISPDEHPVALQVSGSNPERMADSARRCVDLGADIIDLNMGCPAPKVTRNGAGAALLRDPRRAAKVAVAVVQATSVPVTVKIRLGWSENQKNYLEVSRILEDAGISAITLHGRTRKQGYSGEADWNSIKLLKSSLGIPVIGNGDIVRPDQALERLKFCNCDGLMIGRAALKNPWIFGQTESLARTGSFSEPTDRDRFDLIREHFNLLMDSLPPAPALFRMKSFLGKYTAGIKGAVSLRRSLSVVKTSEELFDAFEIWSSDAGNI